MALVAGAPGEVQSGRKRSGKTGRGKSLRALYLWQELGFNADILELITTAEINHRFLIGFLPDNHNSLKG